MIPPYPGSNARARDRVQALQAYYQPQLPHNSATIRTPVASSTRRSSSHSGSVQLAPVASSPDRSAGFVYIPSGSSGHNFQEETHLPSRFHAREREHLPSLPLNHVGRESSWRAYHQTASVSDPSIRSSSFRLRHESDRMPSQNRWYTCFMSNYSYCRKSKFMYAWETLHNAFSLAGMLWQTLYSGWPWNSSFWQPCGSVMDIGLLWFLCLGGHKIRSYLVGKIRFGKKYWCIVISSDKLVDESICGWFYCSG